MLETGILITGIVIAVVLVCLLVKVNSLSKKIDNLSQPVINIDEKAAKLIAEQLVSIPIVETNKYDAISVAMNNADSIGDDSELSTIIRSIANS